MKKLTVLLALVLLVLAACTPRVWYKPGATSDQRDRDLRACRYEAQARFAELAPPLSAFNVCVEAPWGTPAELELRIRDAAEEAVRREYDDYRSSFINNYVHDCMTRKGYSLVEKD